MFILASSSNLKYFVFKFLEIIFFCLIQKVNGMYKLKDTSSYYEQIPLPGLVILELRTGYLIT